MEDLSDTEDNYDKKDTVEEPKNDEEDVEEEEEDEVEEEEEETDTKTKNVDEDCIYNYVELSSEYDDDIISDDSDDNSEINNLVLPEDRKTKPYLTSKERVRILGDREKQLTLGAKPMLKNTGDMTAKDIAIYELAYDVIPLIIERVRPDKKIERWKVSELKH